MKIVKWEQRRFTVSPTVVPAGTKVTVKVKGYGDYHAFYDELEYEVRLIPVEKRDYIINEDFNTSEYVNECNIVDAYSKNGVLHFDYIFSGEQEWFFEIRVKSGQDYLKYYNKWQKMFRKQWGYINWDEFRYDFRLYSLDSDLYELTPFKGDTHTHTEYSDGSDRPEFFCANYRGFGYDFVAVTDHYEYRGSLAAIKKMSELDTNFKVFPGEEVHTIPSDDRFHIVNFNGKASVNTKIIDDYEGVKTEVFELAKKFDWLSERDAQELAWVKWIADEIRKTGGISVLAHPFLTVNHSYNSPTDITVEALRRGFVDAYEITNHDSAYTVNVAAALYNELRCSGVKVPIVGSTDAHCSTDHGQLHAACNSTVVFAKSLEDVPRAIMDLNAVAVRHFPEQEPHIFGSFRHTKYAVFLLENYFPMYSELCKASSVMMIEYFRGRTEFKESIELVEKRIDEFRRDFFGR